MMDIQTQLYITLALMGVSGGLGFYMGARGLTGIKTDLDNTKNEIEKVKNLVHSKAIPQAVTIVTPDGNSPTTNTSEVSSPSSK